VRKKSFELEETFYCVHRIDKLNNVSIRFGYENLLVEQNAFRCRMALRVWERLGPPLPRHVVSQHGVAEW